MRQNPMGAHTRRDEASASPCWGAPSEAIVASTVGPAAVVGRSRRRVKSRITAVARLALRAGALWVLTAGLIVAAIVTIFIGAGIGITVMTTAFAVGAALQAFQEMRAFRRRIQLLEYGATYTAKVLPESAVKRARYLSPEHLPVPIEFTDRAGQTHRVNVRRSSLHVEYGRPAVGTEVEVIADPQNPRSLVVPEWAGIRFVQGPAVQDVRAQLPPPTGDLVAASTPLQFPLLKYPSEGATSVGSLLSGGREPIGTLTVAGDRVTSQIGDSTVSIDLATPFRAEVCAWLIDDTQGEVHLSLRHGTTRIDFRGLLHQSQISPRVPPKESQAPFLDSAAFAATWNAVCAASIAQGDDLRDLLRPGLPLAARPL